MSDASRRANGGRAEPGLAVLAPTAPVQPMPGQMSLPLTAQAATDAEPESPPDASRSTRLMTAGDVALLLGVAPTWVYQQSRAGRIPTVTLGRYRRYRREAIEAWLVELEQLASQSGPCAL